MKAQIVTVAAIVIAVASCNRAQPKMSPSEMDSLRRLAPGMTTDCARKIEFGGVKAMPSQTEQCFQMLPEQRWRGLWRNDLEGSIFCVVPAVTCSHKTDGSNVWFTPKSLHGETGALYKVDFKGRRTKVRGGYGHMGMSAHEIIVDHPISIKLITPAPPPPTEAQLVDYWRRCEAVGSCIPSNAMRKLMNKSK